MRRGAVHTPVAHSQKYNGCSPDAELIVHFRFISRDVIVAVIVFGFDYLGRTTGPCTSSLSRKCISTDGHTHTDTLKSHFNSAVSIGLDKARSGLVSETHKRRHFPPTPHCRLKCQLNSLKIPAELGARQLAYWRTG